VQAGLAHHQVAHLAGLQGRHGVPDLGEHVGAFEGAQVAAVLGGRRIVGILLGELDEVLAGAGLLEHLARLLLDLGEFGRTPLLVYLEEDVPGPELLDGAETGQVGPVVLLDFLVADLDLGAHLLAHEPQALQLLLELGAVLLEGQPLGRQRLHQGLLGHLVLLLHVLDGGLHLVVPDLDVEFAHLLVDEFLVHQPVQGGTLQPHLLGGGQALRVLLELLVFAVQLVAGDQLVVDHGGDAVDDLGGGEGGGKAHQGEKDDAGADLCHEFLS